MVVEESTRVRDNGIQLSAFVSVVGCLGNRLFASCSKIKGINEWHHVELGEELSPNPILSLTWDGKTGKSIRRYRSTDLPLILEDP